MKYYPKETIANNIKIAEQICSKFNKELFNDEIRAYIKVDERRKYLSTVNVCSNIVYSHDLGYEIDVPLKLINKNSDKIPVWILSQMILIYGMLHNLKLTSNHGIYKNKRFKKEADKYGLITEYGDYGWEPKKLSYGTAALVREFKFEKTPMFYEDGATKKASSTHRYVSPDGESIRATKDYHVLYCLTGQPEEVIKQVDMFMRSMGIRRMEVFD